jgi:uncharacterized protein YecT (DUF1311 family)
MRHMRRSIRARDHRLGIALARRWRGGWLIALLLLAPVPALAAGPDCAAADAQAALDLCAAQDLKAADKEMSRVYLALLKAVPDQAAKATLQQAEEAWEVYRDAECKFESSDVEGGSAEAMVLAYCRAARARTRAKVLTRILDCPEGDPTCLSLKR